jgi:hypothetical protein
VNPVITFHTPARANDLVAVLTILQVHRGPLAVTPGADGDTIDVWDAEPFIAGHVDQAPAESDIPADEISAFVTPNGRPADTATTPDPPPVTRPPHHSTEQPEPDELADDDERTCTLCDPPRPFATRTGLLAHRRSSAHATDDYPCDQCPRAFRTQAGLTRHRTEMHPAPRTALAEPISRSGPRVGETHDDWQQRLRNQAAGAI